MGKLSLRNKKMDRDLTKLTYSICLILTFFFLTMTVACNGQEQNNYMSKEAPYNLSDEGDGTQSSYDNLNPKIIEKGKKELVSYGYKFPTHHFFRERVYKVFGIDAFKLKNSIVALRASDFPEIVIKKDNYILVQDSDSENDFFINPQMLFFYNNYIFYNDRNSFNQLKITNPYLLTDLVVQYGYNEDKQLITFVFRNYDFTNATNLHELIFNFNPDIKKFEIRRGIMTDIEQFVYGGITEDLSYAKEGDAYLRMDEIIEKIENNKENYENPDQTIAYLYDKQLQVGITGNLQKKLDVLPQYITFLEGKNFYNFDRLRNYVEVIYEPSENIYANLQSEVYDKDGYTNLRSDKNAQSDILQKIMSGEKIEVLDNSGDWFLVKTKDGKQGYIHKSRIRSQ